MDQSAITESYPLSPMQEGMVFHTVYDPTAGFYIQQMICTLREDLNVSVLNEAWQRVVQRYDILRTCFRWDSELPTQEVHEAVTVLINDEDWRNKRPDEQAKSLNDFIESDRRRGFALNEPPLMRLALFRLSEADYRLVWTFHHALLDGRSHHLVLKEVFKLYEAYCSGQKVELKESRPYHDYLEWLTHRDSSKDEEFWRRRLEGLTVLPSLALEGAPLAQKCTGLHEIHLDERTTSALRSFAKRHALTLNTLVQGAWALLLSHYSGSSEAVFGATRACRRSTLD